MNISIIAEPLFHIAGFPVSNSMLVGWVMSIALIVFGLVACRNLALVPRGEQNVFEGILEHVLAMVDSVTHNRDQSKKFFPLIATIFLLVVSVNWAGLLPGAGSIGLRQVHEGKEILIPFIRSTSADLNFTIALAIISVVAVQVTGIVSIGLFKYAGRFINFSNPLNFFVGILELISEIAKLISFSFRLFGNVFAGEVLLTVMTVLVPYIIPLPFLALEVFVGFIQAFVFAILTLVFLKMASEEMAH
jgi:F-type H+-transporting ATPase subunit a